MLIRDVSSMLKPDLLFRASILLFYQKADLCEGPLPSPPSSGSESPCARIFPVQRWNHMEQRMSDSSGRKLVRGEMAPLMPTFGWTKGLNGASAVGRGERV